MTVEEYLAFEETREETHEYRDGSVVAMTGHARGHGDIALNIAFALRAHLGPGPSRVYQHGFKLRVEAANHFVCPDIMVVCDEGAHTDKFATSAKLVVEVLSPSTRDYDRGKKFKIYRQLESLEDLMDADRRRFSLEYSRLQLQLETDEHWLAQQYADVQSRLAELTSLNAEIERLREAEAAGAEEDRMMAFLGVMARIEAELSENVAEVDAASARLRDWTVSTCGEQSSMLFDLLAGAGASA